MTLRTTLEATVFSVTVLRESLRHKAFSRQTVRIEQNRGRSGPVWEHEFSVAAELGG
jgi:hypothetical protein